MSFKDEREKFAQKYKEKESTNVIKQPDLMERFFSYKFENKEEALKGIIFHGKNELILNTRDISSIQKRVQVLTEEIFKYFIHFYRFTEYNDNLDIKSECENIQNGIKSYKNIDTTFLYDRIENMINKLIDEKKLISYPIGLYFTAFEEARYKKAYNTLPHISYEDINYISHNNSWWTEDLFKVVTRLRKLEPNNEELYYKRWLRCLRQRIIHSQKSPEEIAENLKMFDDTIYQYEFDNSR